MGEQTFDDAIIALTPQLDQAKADLASDPTTIALKQYGDKGDVVQGLQRKIEDTQSKKATFITLQAQIDAKTAEITDLETQKKALEDSVK